MYTITVETEDCQTVEFECGPSEDIITAGLRNNVILLSSCREGGCATCKAECTDGEYEIFNASVQALPPDEEEDGMVLLCRTFPRSALNLKLPYTIDRIAFQQQRTVWAGQVAACDRVASNVCRLVISVQDPDTGAPASMDFKPGQFVDIEVPGVGCSRSYSMANLPGSRDLEFFIRLQPDGVFSRFLMSEPKPGAAIHLRGPFGAFGIHENGLRPRYFIAGGTGLSPLLSMARWMDETGDPHPARLFVGVTTEEEMFFGRELRALAASRRPVDTNVAVMRPTNGWRGFTGTVVDHVLNVMQETNERPDLYLCGPPGMIDAMMRAALNAGIPRGHVYFEKFLPS
jgi:methane monooxygenase component C